MWTRLLYLNTTSSIPFAQHLHVNRDKRTGAWRAVQCDSLTPDTAPPPDASIRGIVTLSWPYSSSTQQCALLLADPDFRLRKQKGQVRVCFTGDAAAAVARAHLGVGDEVVLRLQGSSWADRVDATRTPGRSVDGELSFGRHVELTIKRTTGDVVVKVDVPSPALSSEWDKPAPDTTPQPALSRYSRSRFSGGIASVQIYSSPAFNKRSRLSGNYFLDSNYDPFQSVGVEDEQPRKKLRLSFGAVESWRYSGGSPSPVKRTPSPAIELQAGQEPPTIPVEVEVSSISADGAIDVDKPESDALATTRKPEVSASEVVAAQEVVPMELDVALRLEHPLEGPRSSQSAPSTTMLPPPLPRLQVPPASLSPETLDSQQDEGEKHDGPSTPKLQAIPNSALPLPSPFPSSAKQEHFESLRPDHRTRAADDDTSARKFEGHEHEVLTIDDEQPNVPTQATEHAQEIPALEYATQLHGNLNRDAQQDAGEEDAEHSDYDEADVADEQHAGGELERREVDSDHGVRRRDEHAVHGKPRKPYEGLKSQPQTPVRLVKIYPVPDGAASAAPRAAAGSRSTPQSQHDKVMARTYSSLFGFRTSPPPQTVSSQQSAADVAPLARRLSLSVPMIDSIEISNNEVEPTIHPATVGKEREAELAEEYRTARHAASASTEPGVFKMASPIPSPERTTEREPALSLEPKVDHDSVFVAEAEADGDGETQEPLPDGYPPVSTPSYNEVVESDLEVQPDPVGVPIESAEPDVRPLHYPQPEVIELDPSSVVEEPIGEEARSNDVDYAEAPFEEQRIGYGPTEDNPKTNDMFQTTIEAKGAKLQGRDDDTVDYNDDTESSIGEDVAVFDNVVENEVHYEDFLSELESVAQPEQLDNATHSQLMADEMETDDSLPSPLPTSELNGFAEGVLPLILMELESSSSPYPELVTPRRIQVIVPADDLVVPSQFTPERVIEESQNGEIMETFDTQQISLAEDFDVISVPMREPAPELSAKEAEQPQMVAFPAPQDGLADSVAHILSQPLNLQGHVSTDTLEVVELTASSPIKEDNASVLDTHGSPSPTTVDMLDPFRTEGATFEEFVEVDMLTSPTQTQPIAIPPSSARQDSQAISALDEDGHEDEDQSHSQMTTFSHEGQTTAVANPVLPYSAEFESQLPHVTSGNISYPTLPPSPLQSQPLPEERSSPVHQSHQEIAESAMPPTPQLTQEESDLQLATTVTSQISTLSDPQSAESQIPAVVQATREATTQTTTEVTLASTEEQLVTVTSADPNTLIGPLTQSDGAADERKTPRNSRNKDNGARVGKPARKSLKARLSNVPDVISAWFSPKGSSGFVANALLEQHTEHRASRVGHTDSQVSRLELHKPTSNGVSTSLGYFTTLASLGEKLNATSQDALVINTVDVLAVVTDSTKAPERAKGGPRDYYTVMRIADTSQPSSSNTRVEVFRPWKAVLPVADVGDVVLLRAFSVKSKKRQAYLLSTDASSWCVWRYGDTKLNETNEGKPVWARKSVDGRPDGMREEIKGPPVELGEEERRHAGVLREWWITVGGKSDVAKLEDEDGGLELNGEEHGMNVSKP
ncbi:hypothetical protein LTS09_001145 [Friedmanniomyces endolithicus]|nr:hypothetical protein LTS09_001145 [Friedmanniomyces endolithicus]